MSKTLPELLRKIARELDMVAELLGEHCLADGEAPEYDELIRNIGRLEGVAMALEWRGVELPEEPDDA